MNKNIFRSAFKMLLFFTVFVLLYGPIWVPLASSFFAVEHGRVNWEQFSLSAYVQLLNNEAISVALRNTLVVGGSAVLLSLILGCLFSVYYHFSQSKLRAVVQFVIFLPFMMPPIITGLSLLIFFESIDFRRSLLTVVIGHTAFVLALVYRTILTRLEAIGPTLLEAAADLGSTSWQSFYYILLPNIKSTLIGAGIMAFALSFDETMITILMTGTDNTLPIRLWAMMRLGFTPDINALVVMILGFTTVCVLVAAHFILQTDSSKAAA